MGRCHHGTVAHHDRRHRRSRVAGLGRHRSSDGDRKHSLLGLLDETCTPMGARRLKDGSIRTVKDPQFRSAACKRSVITW